MPRPSCPTSHARTNPFRVFGPALALVASLALGACSSSPAGPDAQDPASQTAPAAPVTEPGLEVITWVSNADDRAFAAALAPFDAPVPDFPEPDRSRWRDAGLRILHLSAKDAATLQAALSGPGSSQRQWLGQAFTWTPLVTGPDLPPRAFIATGADRLRLPSAPQSGGVLRLLTRCWIAPALSTPASTSSTPAILTIELLPQHKEAIDPTALVRAPSINALDAGMTFSRLAITLSARPSSAYVIVAEDPAVSWADPAATSSEPAALPDAPLLGQAMLAGPPARPSSAEGPYVPARSRLITLLLPRVPDRFTLAPSAR